MVWLLGFVVWTGASIVTALTVGRALGQAGERDAAVVQVRSERPEAPRSTAVGG